MKRVALVLVVFCVLSGAASAQAQAPHSLAGARSADSADGKAVLAPIDGLFAALDKGDGTAMLRHVFPDGKVTAAGKRPDGSQNLRQQTWTQFAERLSPERAFQERITNPAISIDDDIAMVWAFFVVRAGGKVNSCGIDHFDLSAW